MTTFKITEESEIFTIHRRISYTLKEEFELNVMWFLCKELGSHHSVQQVKRWAAWKTSNFSWIWERGEDMGQTAARKTGKADTWVHVWILASCSRDAKAETTCATSAGAGGLEPSGTSCWRLHVDNSGLKPWEEPSHGGPVGTPEHCDIYPQEHAQ